LFETRVEDFIIKSNEIQGVVTHKGDKILSNKIILATGHSARDIFELLDRKNIYRSKTICFRSKSRASSSSH